MLPLVIMACSFKGRIVVQLKAVRAIESVIAACIAWPVSCSRVHATRLHKPHVLQAGRWRG